MIKDFYFGERLEWMIKLPHGHTLELIASQNSGNLFERMLKPGIGVRVSKNNVMMTIGRKLARSNEEVLKRCLSDAFAPYKI